jgi:hypothetical protein
VPLSYPRRVLSTGTHLAPSRVLVLILALIALVAAGCGGDDDDSTKAPPPPDIVGEQQQTPPKGAIEPINMNISARPLAGPTPLTVQFNAQAFDTEGDVLYRWSFDDGTTKFEQAPTKTFTKPGFYVVVVDARDEKGGQRTQGAFIAAWPKALWESGRKRSVSQLDIKGRQDRMWKLTRARRAALIAQYRAEQRKKLAEL